MKAFSLAVLCVAASASAAYLFLPLSSQFPAVLPLLFLLAVAASGVYGRFRASLSASALSVPALAALEFRAHPSQPLLAALRTAAFFAIAVALSYLLRALRHERYRKTRAEADLRATNERLSMILGSISESFIALDREWRFQYANQRVLDYRGLPWSEMQGRTLWEIFPAALHTAFKPGYEKVMRERVPHTFEASYPEPDGTVKYFLVHAAPTRDGLSSLVADITERRETENELVESRARLRLVLESAGIGTFLHDLKTNQLTDLGNTDAVLGVSGVPTLADLLAIVHPDDRPLIDRAIERAMASGRLESEHRIRRPDGSIRTIRAVGSLLRDDAGLPVRLAGVITDVTERNRAEEARARLAAIVDSSLDPILSKDLDGIVTSWNHAAVQLFGYRPEEILGQSIYALIPPELHAEEAQTLEKLRSGRPLPPYETRRLARDGSLLEIALTISPIYDPSGRISGASSIARDITERVRMQQAIIDSEKLAATGRMAAAIAHEINNPLEAVINLAFLLSIDPALSDSARTYANLLLQEISRVSHVTKQSLAFFRDSAKPAEYDICELLDSVTGLNQPLLDRKQIRILRSLPDRCIAWGSALEMRQVFANLVRNSIEALAPGGRLHLRVRTTSAGLRVTIADNGHGIPPETLARLFQPFVTSKGVAGNGLGLWVSSGIVKKHNGAIRVRTSSRPGHSGTVFSVVLPAYIPTATPQPHPALP